jgi:protein involved in polysaccharide export with SLBB domain
VGMGSGPVASSRSHNRSAVERAGGAPERETRTTSEHVERVIQQQEEQEKEEQEQEQELAHHDVRSASGTVRRGRGFMYRRNQIREELS